MFLAIRETISSLNTNTITQERKQILNPLTEFIQNKIDNDEVININFICTHNSRRSHLSQIWMKTLADHRGIPNVYCYSGGTEATAMASGVLTTLKNQGFDIQAISDESNTVYAVKYGKNAQPIIGFSKRYDDPFNPEDSFAAIMTCSQADGGCPFIAGAEKRIPITFEDPKLFDGTDQEKEKYQERSIQIATEILYVLQQVKT
ncbi:protein-tyrosine-phosphatase [Flavobacteriaceae bacterium S356]|uniref:Protein-tyrosine-phosphatase n=1 Tax=Asprobacillus argus TaxID=3076534 RepID=A0ABU3LIR9_9FLAO|nr:protein-tyrosine-phosphatase [Flavobacteriaceae bacterium S356]